MIYDLTISLAAETIFLIILFIVGKFWNSFNMMLRKKNPNSPRITLLLLFLIWIGMNTTILYLTSYENQVNIIFMSFFILSSLILFYTYREQINQFWAVGLSGADKNLIDGIDFDQSLKLCQYQLDFLGVGAAKLTKSKEFENALVRCCQSRPIRFLLCKPDDLNLASAAKRAGRSTDEYRNIVTESLKKIANLKKHRDLKIEVRYYTDKPMWRLMFINKSICLLGSYSDFGRDDGTNLPQLHIVKLEDSYPQSFFHALELYFEKLWENAEPWDFEAYI